MFYFTYGSNLSSARLKKRVPSAKLHSRGWLGRHRLCFHKVGMDGSAKCDAFHTGDDRDNVLGAVYSIDQVHKGLLARAEGLGSGYAEKQVTIITDEGKKVEAFTYCATDIDATLKPFHWYKGHVLIGAKEHDFPGEYIAQFLAVESIDDPDMERMNRELGIHGIGRSGRPGRL